MVERSIDKVWGDGGDGSGQNAQGKILEKVRAKIMQDHSTRNARGNLQASVAPLALGQPGGAGLVRNVQQRASVLCGLSGTSSTWFETHVLATVP